MLEFCFCMISQNPSQKPENTCTGSCSSPSTPVVHVVSINCIWFFSSHLTVFLPELCGVHYFIFILFKIIKKNPTISSVRFWFWYLQNLIHILVTHKFLLYYLLLFYFISLHINKTILTFFVLCSIHNTTVCVIKKEIIIY